jgi:hypothetical protein
MTLTGGVADIEINRRYIRDERFLQLDAGSSGHLYLFPIKDIISGEKLLYLFKSYNAIVLFGPLTGFHRMTMNQSDTFIKDHNEYMIQNIMQYSKKPREEDPDGIGEYKNYYSVNGLILFKRGLEEYQGSGIMVE